MLTFEDCRAAITPHLVPVEQVLDHAGRDLDDPATEATRSTGYPWSMALADLIVLPGLASVLAGAIHWRGARVLDAGCGPGVFAHALRGLGASEVQAVDLNDDMLGAAAALGAHVPGVELAKADLRDLPFADASFDAVFCGDVPLADQLRGELWRVLRPGGWFVGKRTGILPMCTTAWDPTLDQTSRAALAEGMRLAGPPWSTREPGWHLRDLISESGKPAETFTTVLAEASAPLPEVWRASLRERFAIFEGPFVKAGASDEDWARIRELWRPGSPEQLTERPDAYVALPISVFVVRRPT